MADVYGKTAKCGTASAKMPSSGSKTPTTVKDSPMARVSDVTRIFRPTGSSPPKSSSASEIDTTIRGRDWATSCGVKSRPEENMPGW